MIHNNTAVLNGITLYHPMVEIWSGTVRVKRSEDLKAANDHLPPAELVSDGRKRIVRRDPLRPLLAKRKQLDRLLRSVGFPFMGGVAVPDVKAAMVDSKIAEIETDFNNDRINLCNALADEYDLQEEKYPEWAEMLRSSRLDEASVMSRCRFDVVSHRVAAPDATVCPGAAQRFSKIADAALPTLLKTIAADAENILEESVKGKGRISTKTVNVVRRLVDKLDTFSFLDPRVDPLAQALHTQLGSLPSSGYLSGSETVILRSILTAMADPEDAILQAAAIQSTIDPLSDSADAPQEDEVTTPVATDLCLDTESLFPEGTHLPAVAVPQPVSMAVVDSSSPYEADF